MQKTAESRISVAKYYIKLVSLNKIPEEIKGMELKITLTDEQVDMIAEKVFRKLAESNHGKRTKPYSVKEFAEETGMSKSLIYEKLKYRQISTVPEVEPTKIPASELKRFI